MNDHMVFKISHKGQEFAVLINKQDVPHMEGKAWYIHPVGKTCYVRWDQSFRGKRTRVFLHRLLLGASSRQVVDHVNGNGLDNRRKNLRLCTKQENHFNSSKTKSRSSSRFRGVHWDKTRSKWSAQIMCNYKSIPLGRFEKEEDAAKAYNQAAREFFGEFARLNDV